MKVTLESIVGSDLIYVYKGDPLPSGTTVTQTKQSLNAELLFNDNGAWAGLVVFPSIDFDGTSVIFDGSYPLMNSKPVRANVDIYNGEVFGVELITPKGLIGSTELITDILEIKN